MQLFILFSSDYELFLGENYLDEREILIDPTDQLLATCEELGIPMALFADVACVWRYRELGVPSDFPDLCEAQLRYAVSRGHDVQLHLHPHWLTSTYDGDRWQVDPSRFKLGDVGFARSRDGQRSPAEQLIFRGRDYLVDLIGAVEPSYRCIAFRAGGYGLQPQETEVLASLLRAGFLIDSSVVPEMVYRSNVNAIDFRAIPARMNSRFGPTYGLNRSDPSGIFEIPVAAYRESLAQTITRSGRYVAGRFARRLARIAGSDGHLERGSGIQTVGWLERAVATLRYRSHFSLELSGRSLDADRMVAGTRRFIESHRGESSELFFSASCHPKEVYPETLVGIRRYWSRMKQLYGESIKAITYQEAAKMLPQPVTPCS